MSNDFGGGFDATDEATKVAAPPLANITPPTDPAAYPVPTNRQPTDGIGIRQYSEAGQLFHPLGTWTAATGTTDATPIVIGNKTQAIRAGTQAIDTSKPL